MRIYRQSRRLCLYRSLHDRHNCHDDCHDPRGGSVVNIPSAYLRVHIPAKAAGAETENQAKVVQFIKKIGMKHIKVFAPGTVANLGCGFDVMGLTLDGVGDVLEVGVAENAEGFEIRNRSGMELPGNVEENVITPAVRALLEAYGRPVRIEVEILEKIAPGSGIGSSAASSAAAR